MGFIAQKGKKFISLWTFIMSNWSVDNQIFMNFNK